MLSCRFLLHIIHKMLLFVLLCRRFFIQNSTADAVEIFRAFVSHHIVHSYPPNLQMYLTEHQPMLLHNVYKLLYQSKNEHAPTVQLTPPARWFISTLPDWVPHRHRRVPHYFTYKKSQPKLFHRHITLTSTVLFSVLVELQKTERGGTAGRSFD